MKRLFAIFVLITAALYSYANDLNSNHKFHLVWQVDTNIVCELDWTRELLSCIDHDEIFDGQYSVFMDNSIIVVEGSKSEFYKPYFDRLNAMGCKFGVIVHSDETNTSPTDFYSQVRFVLRNYWKKEYEIYPKARPIPLGYIRDFLKNCSNTAVKSIAERKYIWGFAGDINKTTRSEMISAMQCVSNGRLHTISSWKAPDSLSRDEYRNLLSDSIFAPAPMGNCNPDTFRIYEALECGCIPIIEKFPSDYYFSFLLGEYPFLCVNSWNEVPSLIQGLLTDMERLEDYRKKCYIWWQNYKRNLKLDLALFINTQLSDEK